MKKISRKDISKMSTMEFLKAGAGPYRQLAGYLKPYKGRFFFGIFFGALYGLMNGGMVLTIKYVGEMVFGVKDDAKEFEKLVDGLPEKAVAEGGAAFDAVRAVFEEASAANSGTALSGSLLMAAMLVPAIMLLRGFCGYMNSYCMLWVSLRVLSDIRIRLFSKLMGQSLDFYNKQKGGELIQTVFNQTRMTQQALTTVASDIIKQPIAVLSAIAAIFIIDWKFALAALVLFPICIIPVIVVGRKVRKSGGKEEEEAGMLMVVMQESFAGIRVVKSHAREAHEIAKFTDANNKMMKFIMRWRKAMELVGPLVETVASFGVAAALVYVAIRPDLGAAHFLALQCGLVLLYPPAKTLSRLHILMQKCLAATTKVFEMMEREPAIKDAEDAVDIDGVGEGIAFEEVSFAYGKRADAVTAIDFSIEQGKSYALVGQSGAGKSTLFSLLLRFYEPREGRITVGGVDIRKIKQASLRDNIGVVNQDTFLFHDSIYENIRYGKLDATREEIEHAARLAHAHEFIVEQDKGYDTKVGDKGCQLSGGQQQRISIARAILRDAPILLLDEATSALDSEAEKHIQAALEALSKGKTTIAIAHRLSTILNADQIVVMHRGRVCEAGTHAELMEESDIYRRLYMMQFGHEMEEKKADPE
jgi:subfamily B ATP-binding cassette protein MsbA